MLNAAKWLNIAAILMTVAFIAFAIGSKLHPELLSVPLLAFGIAQALNLARKP